MTNGEKLIEIFPNNVHISLKRTTQFTINPMTINQQIIVVDNDFWNAEYKEPTTEREQKINKSDMMQEIYMEGVNMAGEYQGCWVRFKEIEKIVDRYVR